MPRKKVMGFSSEVGMIFLYFSILKPKTLKCSNLRLNDANDFIFSHKHNIHMINIFCKFGENPMSWRHVTSHDVFSGFLAKKCWETADVGRNQCLWCNYFYIFHIEHCFTFKMSGRPTFYHYWFKSYNCFCKTYVFDKILMTSSRKSADVGEIMTSSEKIWCQSKLLRLLYNRDKLQPSPTIINDFR